MADDIKATVRGLDDLKRALGDLPDKIRRQALRNALAAGARWIRDISRAAAPVLDVPTKRRKPGTVRDAIVVRTSKFARQRGDVGVFVSVRPLKGSRQKKLGRAGRNNPNDPFYWRFVEFGTRFMAAQPFLRRAAQQLNGAVDIILAKAGPAIDKLNKRG